MGKYLLVLIFAFLTSLLSCQNNSNGNSETNYLSSLSNDTLQELTEGAGIHFDVDFFVIDSVHKNSEFTYGLVFQNPGNKPLLITNVKTSCNCTVANYPKEPILPGHTNEIELILDTKRTGQFTKRIAVYSNALNKEVVPLKIRWTVKE